MKGSERFARTAATAMAEGDKMAGLTDAISAYEEALKDLRAQTTENSQSRVISAILTRVLRRERGTGPLRCTPTEGDTITCDLAFTGKTVYVHRDK
jgi:hypothetical protein